MSVPPRARWLMSRRPWWPLDGGDDGEAESGAGLGAFARGESVGGARGGRRACRDRRALTRRRNRSTGGLVPPRSHQGRPASGWSVEEGRQRHPPPNLVVRRGIGSGEGGSSSADFVDDLLGGDMPDERLGVVVPVLGPGLDGVDELGDAGEYAVAEAPVGELFEPALDEVEPRR